MTIREAFFKQQWVVLWINVKNSAMKNALSWIFDINLKFFLKSKKPVISNNVIGRQRRYILIKLHHVVSIYLCGSIAITSPYFLVCFTFT